MSPGAPGFEHRPVMVDDVVAILEAVPTGLVVDATVGGAGHARALLEARPDLRLLGLDRDPAALAAAGGVLAPFGDRVVLRHAGFDGLAAEVGGTGSTDVSGVLFDLGVSSPQLDVAGRGFSYRNDGPLDMRMDPGQALTAAEVVNSYDERELARLFAASGESRFAARIARAIVAARPLHRTAELAEVVRSAIPAATRRTGGHPAKRVFQAVRIEVNRELDVLPVALKAALASLVPGGRCVVLAYHSGEDRLVKGVFLEAATGGCTCPPGLPCACGARPSVRLLNRGARKAPPAEVQANPRAESARLRAVEKLPTGGDVAPTGAGPRNRP